MEQGKTALVRVKAATAAGKTVRDGGVVAEFWAPGHDPHAGAAPDHSAECSYDEAQRSWVAHVSTEGWAKGTWRFRGRVAVTTEHGPARGWAWGTLEVE